MGQILERVSGPFPVKTPGKTAVFLWDRSVSVFSVVVAGNQDGALFGL